MPASKLFGVFVTAIAALPLSGCFDSRKSSFVKQCKAATPKYPCECVYSVAEREFSDELMDVQELVLLGRNGQAQSELGKLGFMKQAAFTARSAKFMLNAQQQCGAS